MARHTRLFITGCVHHIIQRGNNRCTCFMDADDRLIYMDFLSEAANKHGVAIHAYVLMSNHVHLLVTPETASSCGRMMQCLGRRYVRYFNVRIGRTGTLWEGRFKSTIVDNDAYFFTVTRYIELNPVRANMVKHPADYRWSSYHANALGGKDALISFHPLYLGIGRDGSERQARYRGLFGDVLDDGVLETLREATNKGWAFGSDEFKAQVFTLANRPIESSGWGGDRRSVRKLDQRSRTLTP